MKKIATIALISLIILYGCAGTTTPAASTFVPLTLNIKPTKTETPFPTLIDLIYPTVTVIPNKTHILKRPTITSLPTRNSPSSTPIPQKVWPTLIYRFPTKSTLSPNETFSTQEPTITAPPTKIYPAKLPGNLKIEEYNVTGITSENNMKDLVLSRHPESGGWYFWPHGGTLYGKQFRAEEVWIDNRVRIRATLDNDEILLVDCTPGSTFPSVITAWVYDQHWIIQSICHQEFDIFWDGISLNTSKGYQSSLGFQILGQRPFYLFKRDKKIWLSYNGQEALLDYDDVKLSYCCNGYAPPQPYENLTLFYATKNDQLYYVAIGLFDK